MRRPGRPTRPATSRAGILAAARDMLESGGLDAVTMRGIARRLRVDPMALYHYFPDREAVLREAATELYGALAVPLRGGWRRRLDALAVAYVELLAGSTELLRFLTGSDRAARVATLHVEQLFRAAIAPLALPADAFRPAHDAFIDFVHGFSLGVPRAGLTQPLRARLRGELAVIADGIAARAPRRGRRR